MLSPQQLTAAAELARQAVVEIAPRLKGQYGRAAFTNKSPGDAAAAANVVTELDHETEKHLEKRLATFAPDIGFCGEEFGHKGNKEMYWLVDPIDGTAHFVRGLPFCTTMVALIDNGQVMAAVISDFVRGDVYWAVRGGGAFRDDTTIHVNDRSLTEAYVGYEGQLDTPDRIQAFQRLRQKTILLETINCGMDFAWVASGKLDGRIMDNPWGSTWDFAPGALLVQEAGGVVANLESSDYNLENLSFIATNQGIYQELTKGPNAIFPLK